MELLIEDAISLASTAHKGQIDEDGLPHIVHALEVMSKAKAEYEQRPLEKYTLIQIIIAAILHDVVEDSDVSIDTVRRLFGDEVADMVFALTRQKGESYRDFIYRCKANAGARLIKVADLLHNRGRTHKISAKKASWRAKLEYKYGIALQVLNSSFEPTWEGASYKVTYDEPDEPHHLQKAHFFIADPNGKEIEITEAEAKNVKASFTHYN
jgi:(p)ppGpp synthase/HD superfamily hydrolase